jgi:hypothetical protein
MSRAASLFSQRWLGLWVVALGVLALGLARPAAAGEYVLSSSSLGITAYPSAIMATGGMSVSGSPADSYTFTWVPAEGEDNESDPPEPETWDAEYYLSVTSTFGGGSTGAASGSGTLSSSDDSETITCSTDSYVTAGHPVGNMGEGQPLWIPFLLTGASHTVTITLTYGGTGSAALGYRLVATRAAPHKMAQELWHTNPQETIHHPWGPNVSEQCRGRWRGYYNIDYKVRWKWMKSGDAGWQDEMDVGPMTAPRKASQPVNWTAGNMPVTTGPDVCYTSKALLLRKYLDLIWANADQLFGIESTIHLWTGN